MRKLILGLTAGLLVAGTVTADKADLVRPFLETYCINCHGEDKQKGDRRFEHLTGNPKTLDDAESLQEILDQLNLAEMPPEDEKQPKPEETQQVVTCLLYTSPSPRDATLSRMPSSA